MTLALTRAQREALAEIATTDLYVGRDPGRPNSGSGIAAATLTVLARNGLITRDAYRPGKGRRLQITDRGRAAIGTGTA